MSSLRVLVVDDALTVRRLVARALQEDGFEVAMAADGQTALAQVESWQPDAVTLDLEMPGLSGLKTLVELRKRAPHLPVIVFAAETQRGAERSLESLALGAHDYVAKPTGPGGIAAAMHAIQLELAPKIRVLVAAERARRVAQAPVPVEIKTAVPRAPVGASVVVIAASTGGPVALAALVPRLPRDLAAPVLIVQHMPPVFTRRLAERLAALGMVPVQEAAEGDPLRPGHVLVAPGGCHLEVVRARSGLCCRLSDAPPENSCRPAADVLLRSVAAHFGARALAVVLTGMGQDGLKGCESIAAAGGRVLAQDPESSVVWGMPGAVARAGLAELLRTPAQLGDEIARRVALALPSRQR